MSLLASKSTMFDAQVCWSFLIVFRFLPKITTNSWAFWIAKKSQHHQATWHNATNAIWGTLLGVMSPISSTNPMAGELWRQLLKFLPILFLCWAMRMAAYVPGTNWAIEHACCEQVFFGLRFCWIIADATRKQYNVSNLCWCHLYEHAELEPTPFQFSGWWDESWWTSFAWKIVDSSLTPVNLLRRQFGIDIPNLIFSGHVLRYCFRISFIQSRETILFQEASTLPSPHAPGTKSPFFGGVYRL